MTACLLYAKIHKNKAENLLHLMLYFSMQDLIDYYHYMEALVAFHRYYSESKTGEENAS